MADGNVDYFDQDGRSAKQFLLRNPVPNGTSAPASARRRHPILGYTRMHTGVDWAAPRGTPIIASGNGVVEKAGWSGGYGRQTIIRHANGYETSYNHQSAIARGVMPGGGSGRVRSSAMSVRRASSTGDHLHYELMVNGRKVDPMRVRLPVGRVLTDVDLQAFERERKRIDDLLEQEGNDGSSRWPRLAATTVRSNAGRHAGGELPAFPSTVSHATSAASSDAPAMIQAIDAKAASLAASRAASISCGQRTRRLPEPRHAGEFPEHRRRSGRRDAAHRRHRHQPGQPRHGIVDAGGRACVAVRHRHHDGR